MQTPATEADQYAVNEYLQASKNIDDIECALDICNDMSGFVTSELNRIEQAGGDPEREAQLTAIRIHFLRKEKSKFTRDNMMYVRQFIQEFAPQVKRCFTTGELPDIFKE